MFVAGPVCRVSLNRTRSSDTVVYVSRGEALGRVRVKRNGNKCPDRNSNTRVRALLFGTRVSALRLPRGHRGRRSSGTVNTKITQNDFTRYASKFEKRPNLGTVWKRSANYNLFDGRDEVQKVLGFFDFFFTIGDISRDDWSAKPVVGNRRSSENTIVPRTRRKNKFLVSVFFNESLCLLLTTKVNYNVFFTFVWRNSWIIEKPEALK